MEEKVVTSKKFSLNKFDWLKALLMAAGTPVLEYLAESLSTGQFDTLDWKHAAAIGMSTGLLYLSKNYFTNTHTTVTEK